MQLPGLAVGDLDHGDAEASENLQIDAGVAAHVGNPSNQEHGHIGAALDQRPGDDEAVAAVVAAAAEYGDLAIEEVAVDGLHRRGRLPAGVLHQHERGDADLFDRAAIRVAHLGRVQYTHYDVIGWPLGILSGFSSDVHRLLCHGSAV